MEQAAHQVKEFDDLETYHEYNQKMTDLHGSLERQYGPGAAEQIIAKVGENVYNQGGDELLHKFKTNPTMLDPEVFFSFMNGAEEAGNPYDQYLQGNGPQVNVGAAPQQAAGPYSHAPQVDLNQVAMDIQQMYDPKVMDSMHPNAWNQKMLELDAQRRQAFSQVQQPGF